MVPAGQPEWKKAKLRTKANDLMRITPARAITPLLATVAVAAALLAAARPLLTTPPPVAGSAVTATVRTAPMTWTQKKLLDASAATLTVKTVPPVPPRTYTVLAGDTLSVIAKKVYGTASAWYLLEKANRLSGDMITAGLVLRLPAPRKNYPAPPAAPVVTTTTAVSAGTTQAPPSSSGAYSYSGLETLWESEGGSPGTAATAACIAEHESGGNPAAFNGRDIGIWQIDPGNEPGANLYNASVNAAEAVKLSGDGTNWSDWSTASACGV